MSIHISSQFTGCVYAVSNPEIQSSIYPVSMIHGSWIPFPFHSQHWHRISTEITNDGRLAQG